MDRKQKAVSQFDKLQALQAALLNAVHPRDRSVSELQLLDEGLSSRVFATGDLIVRVPRHRGAADRQVAIMAALPEIQPLLPIPVPTLVTTIPTSDALPFGAAVLKRLPGIPMQADLAGQSLREALGRFLVALHGILPHHLSTSSNVRRCLDVDSSRREAMEIVLPFLRTVLTAPNHERIAEWWAAYTAYRTTSRSTPSLVHGDLWYGNILVDPGHTQITGVLDWEEMAFDDPAQDFATLRHSGEAFSDEVLAAHARAGGHVDEDLLARREWHWECREIIGIATALKTGDASEVEDGIQKVLNGPMLDPKRSR